MNGDPARAKKILEVVGVTSYLLCPYPLHGHVNPMVPLAEELIGRGEQVVVAVTREFAEPFRAVGCDVVEIHSEVPGALPEKVTPAVVAGIVQTVVNMRRNRPQIIGTIRRAWPTYRPAVVVADRMSLWGVLSALRAGVPLACLSVTFVLGEQMIVDAAKRRYGRRIGGWIERAGLARLHPTQRIRANRAQLALVNVVPELQPRRESFDERHRFVGPLLRDTSSNGDVDLPWERIRCGPTLYVSSGTVYGRGAQFYRTVAEAFQDSEWTVVMATARTDPDELGALPDNVIARRYVPQSAVLPHCAAFITHAGMNSAQEGMSLGVPMVLIPRAPDQKRISERLVELGVGVMLDTEATAREFRTVIEEVRVDEGMRVKLDALSRRIAESGGPKAATDALQRLATGR